MNVLIIEDNEGDYVLLKKQLRKCLPVINLSEQIGSVKEAREILQGQSYYDIIFLDLHLEDSSGLETLNRLLPYTHESPIIILSGLDNEPTSIKALHCGAQDYLIKGNIEVGILKKAIQYSIERQKIKQNLHKLTNRYHHILKASTDVIWEYDVTKKTIAFEIIRKDVNFFNQSAIHPLGLLGLEEANPGYEEFDSILFETTLEKSILSVELFTDQDVFNYEVCLIVDRDASGNPSTVYGCFNDVSALRKANREAANSKMNYMQLFNKNPVPAFIYDRSSLKILDCSISAIEKYGYDKEVMTSMLISELWPIDKQLAITLKLFKEEFGFVNFEEHITITGNKMYVDVECGVSDYFGKPSVHLAVIDITDKISLEQELTRTQIERQNLITRSVMQAQEDERQLIARELHDNVNQLLVTANLHLQMAESTLNTEFIQKGRVIIQKSISEIRALSKELSTPVLNDVGLAEAVSEMIRELNSCQAIKFQFHADAGINLKKDISLNLFRIIQEQVNNTVKYSKAKNCTIFLHRLDSTLQLKIEDDGIGAADSKSNGIGLKNIENRCKIYGGSFQIITGKEKGFGIEVVIPLTKFDFVP